MQITFLIFVELAILGLCTGFMAGLLGIGGGMLMVPFITMILSDMNISSELSVKMAIATSMASIVFTSVSSVRAHHQKGAVQWHLVRRFAPGIVIGSTLASVGVFSLLKGTQLALIFALFVGFSATQMFLDKKPSPTRQLPNNFGMVGIGTFIGFLSGLVGAGGGFISVPIMTWCNVAIHQAVATSAALGFPIALNNAVGYIISGYGESNSIPYTLGYIWIPGLFAVASFSVLTAPYGAKIAHRLPVKKLKRIFAIILYFLAIYMAYRGLIH